MASYSSPASIFSRSVGTARLLFGSGLRRQLRHQSRGVRGSATGPGRAPPLVGIAIALRSRQPEEVQMLDIHRAVRRGALVLAALATLPVAGCRSGSEIGEVLGTVLGGQGQGQTGQLAGTIAGVDTQNQQIGVQASNGQTIALGYDQNTRVVYNNQNYQVTALERGDQVVARVIDRGNGAYYTDSISVTASVQSGSGASGGTAGNVQSLQGTVRQVDRTNGLFSVELTSGQSVVVSLPYNPRQSDVTRFQALRAGDRVRFTGAYLNNTRVELREFY
jgi:hypothetical protein